ncbi:MAG: type II secretion system protein [Patescibacteria group bacterium]|nr:type II secretion system protein [Patescibacteria group bacterium]
MISQENWKLSTGFSLIELLVSVTIMMLVVGIGVPGYIEFNKRQQIREIKAQIEVVIELARENARSGQMDVCERLYGYEIAAVTSQDVKIRPVCIEGTTPDWGDVDTYYSLPDSYWLTNIECLAFEFRSLNSDIIYKGNEGAAAWLSASSPWEIRVSSADRTYTFELDQAGTVTKGSWI